MYPVNLLLGQAHLHSDLGHGQRPSQSDAEQEPKNSRLALSALQR